MNSTFLQITSALFFSAAILMTGHAQNLDTESLAFEVKQVFPPLSWDKEDLEKAETLADLNPYYKPEWIREYLSVEILTTTQGKTMINPGEGNFLTQDQKKAINTADAGTEIEVHIHYVPENTLSQNDPKEFDFSFSQIPEHKAQFPGGQEAMEVYLNKSAINDIPEGTFTSYDLAIVTFTVDRDGEIINPKVFESSKDSRTDALLLQAIQNMPSWGPAKYADGTKVKQDFALTVGNMKSCIMNLLNFGRNLK